MHPRINAARQHLADATRNLHLTIRDEQLECEHQHLSEWGLPFSEQVDEYQPHRRVCHSCGLTECFGTTGFMILTGDDKQVDRSDQVTVESMCLGTRIHPGSQVALRQKTATYTDLVNKWFTDLGLVG